MHIVKKRKLNFFKKMNRSTLSKHTLTNVVIKMTKEPLVGPS